MFVRQGFIPRTEHTRQGSYDGHGKQGVNYSNNELTPSLQGYYLALYYTFFRIEIHYFLLRDLDLISSLVWLLRLLAERNSNPVMCFGCK